MPKLAFKISEINDQLADDMNEFKMLENDIWVEYRQKRIHHRSSSDDKPRVARQTSGQCACNGNNQCPSGPPGLFLVKILLKNDQ